MDDSAVDTAAHEHALRGLNRINHLLGVDSRLATELQRLSSADGSVLDIGCGGGGVLGSIARRKGQLLGVDRSTFALRCAMRWQPPDIHWMAGDALRLPLADNSIDVVTCSLFLHHFDEPQAIEVLREAARVARKAVIVADLVRSWFAWAITWITTRIVSRSRIFRVDGPRSVRAAYRPRELVELSRQAGLASASVRRTFPFRMILVWKKAGVACPASM